MKHRSRHYLLAHRIPQQASLSLTLSTELEAFTLTPAAARNQDFANSRRLRTSLSSRNKPSSPPARTRKGFALSHTSKTEDRFFLEYRTSRFNSQQIDKRIQMAMAISVPRYKKKQHPTRNNVSYVAAAQPSPAAKKRKEFLT